MLQHGEMTTWTYAESRPAPLAEHVDSLWCQPHMTAEFRELSGITPGEFLLARHPVGDGTTAADLRS
jgi:hypothetical protein